MFDPFFYTIPKPGHYVPRTYADYWSLTIDASYITRVNCRDRVSNEEIRKRVFRNERNACSLDKLLNLHRLRWLGHVLRMQRDRLPSRTIYAEAAQGWKKLAGIQPMTWL